MKLQNFRQPQLITRHLKNRPVIYQVSIKGPEMDVAKIMIIIVIIIKHTYTEMRRRWSRTRCETQKVNY